MNEYQGLELRIATLEAQVRAAKSKMTMLALAETERLWGLKLGSKVKRHDNLYVVIGISTYRWPSFENRPHLDVHRINKDGSEGTRKLHIWSTDWRLA